MRAFLDEPASGLPGIRALEAMASAEDPPVLGGLAMWAAYYGDAEHALSMPPVGQDDFECE